MTGPRAARVFAQGLYFPWLLGGPQRSRKRALLFSPLFYAEKISFFIYAIAPYWQRPISVICPIEKKDVQSIFICKGGQLILTGGNMKALHCVKGPPSIFYYGHT